VALGARQTLGKNGSGDVVNTAAASDRCSRRRDLVGEATYRATSQASSTATHRRSSEGKANPVPAWEAVAARARFGFDVEQRPRAQLVGRARELDFLTGALERVRRTSALSP